MKKYVLSFFFFLISGLFGFKAIAQDRNNEDEVVKLDQFTRYNSVPNQLLVKFVDGANVKLNNLSNKKFKDANTTINAVLTKYSIKSIEQLFPQFVYNAQRGRSSKAYNGEDVVEHDLSQIYLITLNPTNNSKGVKDEGKRGLTNFDLIEDLKKLSVVEYSEPNYIAYALGEESSEQQAVDLTEQTEAGDTTIATTDTTYHSWYTDPMYSAQWGILA